jgi:TolB-like protein
MKPKNDKRKTMWRQSWIIATVLSLAGAAGSAAAQTSLSVAVYDFRAEAEAAGYGSKVTALVTADLAAQTNLVVLERAKLNRALNEQAFGVSGMVSSDAAAQIGQITGAKVLVSGQVVQTAQGRLVILANIIGTETGRLFAAKVEGGGNNLMELSSDLSGKIVQVISSQATNLIAAGGETDAARLERIVRSVQGTNRPSVSVAIHWPDPKSRYTATAEWEFGIVLLKAGFQVVDAKSERKADIEINGVCDHSEGPRRGELFSNRAVMELKVQERQTGNIIVIDRQESTATGPTSGAADRLAQVMTVDELAARVLPLIAK